MTNDTFLSAAKTMCKNCIHSPVCCHKEDAEGYAERLDACPTIKPAPVTLSLVMKCQYFKEANLQSGTYPLWPINTPQWPINLDPNRPNTDGPFPRDIVWCDSNGLNEAHSTPDPNIQAYSKYDGAHGNTSDSTLNRIRRGEGLKPLEGDTSGIYIEGSNKKDRKR